MLRRRDFLVGAAACGALGRAPLALAAGPGEARLVLLLIRGGWDGLAVAPPWRDPRFPSLRPDQERPLDLGGPLGLHPALGPLAAWYGEGDLALAPAVATPYRERSHFDAQEVLENGVETPFSIDTGWLGRALGREHRVLAVGRQLPRVLEGAAGAPTADPTWRRQLPPELLEAVGRVMEEDPRFAPAWRAGLALEAELAQIPGGRRPGGADATFRLGHLLAGAAGPRVATLELGGFDTHAGQNLALGRQLGLLSEALLALREGLGATWAQTVVVVVSEFGRTAAPNGTGGTDHGTGGLALLAGGAVRGGRVVTPWPGLERLADGRDLAPATDLRALFKGVLRDHLGQAPDHLEEVVFPKSGAAPALDGLIG